MSVLAPVRHLFRAVARTVVPAAAALDETGWTRAEDVVERALDRRSAGVGRQLRVFLRAVDAMARLRFGRGFAALAPEQAHRLLAWLERAPLVLLRRGMWGVRTLAFMALYADSDAGARLGYRADARGWAARAGGQGPWPDRDGRATPESTTWVSGAGGPPGA